MNVSNDLTDPAFPRSNAYHPDWIRSSASGGANSLWLTEWLTTAIEFENGMKVLDLGCGRAASSIFLAREFPVSVWAADLWFDPSENLQRIRDAGLSNRVFPLRADARSLPFAEEFFDVILSIDAFAYFGTDDFLLANLARFVRPGGVIAFSGSGFASEFENGIPAHLSKWFEAEPAIRCLHSPDWWRKHWERSCVVDVEAVDTMPEGWQRWLTWQKAIAPENLLEIESIEADRGENLVFFRVVGRRRAEAPVLAPIGSLPTNYSPAPLLRDPD